VVTRDIDGISVICSWVTTVPEVADVGVDERCLGSHFDDLLNIADLECRIDRLLSAAWSVKPFRSAVLKPWQ